MKPNIVADYNLGMPGIDRSDQMLSYYQGIHKTVCWYKKNGFHFIEIYIICLNLISHKVVRF